MRKIIYLSIFFITYLCNVSSMVAEIGGYSGLLIGFSLMDMAKVFNKIVSYIS